MSEPPESAATLSPIPTRVGWAIVAEHYWFGRRVMAELAGNCSVPELLAHAVGNESPDAETIAVMNDLATVMSVADPRIWPLKLGRLVASFGGGMAAIAAVELAFDSDFIGPWTCSHAAHLLVAIQNEVGPAAQRADIEQALTRRLDRGDRLIGFGVPARAEDERVTALRARMKERRRSHMAHWQLFDSVTNVLREKRGLQPNIGMGVAAAALDAGFTPDQIGYLAVALMHNVIVANAVEGAALAPAQLQRLPSSAVRYAGTPPRRSPRAQR